MAHVSPMIRARVEQIKGVDLQKYVDDRTPKEIQRGFGRMLLSVVLILVIDLL